MGGLHSPSSREFFLCFLVLEHWLLLFIAPISLRMPDSMFQSLTCLPEELYAVVRQDSDGGPPAPTSSWHPQGADPTPQGFGSTPAVAATTTSRRRSRATTTQLPPLSHDAARSTPVCWPGCRWGAGRRG